MSASTNLNVVITAKDEASATIKGVENATGGMKAGLLAVGAAAGVALGAVAIFAKQSIDSANESAKAQAQLGAVLKSTGEAAGLSQQDLNDQSAALQRMTTYSDEAVTSAQSLLLTFTNIKGGVFQQSIGTILDMSTALGQDLKSSSIQVGKALNDPINGITALSRVGVSFTQQQKDMITQLVNTGHTMDAQKVILAELNKEFGGSAVAAGKTFAGQMAILNNQFDEVKESVGRALIPVLQALGEKVLPLIVSFANWLSEMEQSGGIVKGIATIFGGFMQQFDAATGLVTLFTDAWNNVVFVFQNSLEPSLKKLWDALQPLQPFLKAFAEVVGGALVIAFGALILLLQAAAIVLVGILTVLTDIVTYIVKIFSGTINGLIELFSNLILALQSVEDTAKSVFASVLTFIKPVIDAVNSLISAVSKAASGLGSIASSVGKTVSSAVSSVSGHKAGGGAVFGGSTYMVGEHGAELFTPSMSGSIVPNSSLAGGGGLVVNIMGGTYLSEDAARQLGDMIIGQLKLKARI